MVKCTICPFNEHNNRNYDNDQDVRTSSKKYEESVKNINLDFANHPICSWHVSYPR